VSEPLLLGVKQAAPIAGVGRDLMYRLVAEGRIRSVHVGRKRLIPRSELEAWIARELEANVGGEAMRDRPAGNGRDPHRSAPAEAS
jgi:excisionase family DNA binding protein